MSERMHPEDLRAIVAATLWAGARADETNRAAFGWTKAIKCADNLLAELSRAAKAARHPSITVCPHCTGRAVNDEPFTHAQGCPLAPLPRTCSEVDETAAVPLRRRTHEEKVAYLMAKIVDLEAAKAQATRDERERIIAVLLRQSPEAFVTQGMGMDWPEWRKDALRSALEPRP